MKWIEHVARMEHRRGAFGRNLMERLNFEDLGIDGGIILK
jgi:hypothetical protein